METTTLDLSGWVKKTRKRMKAPRTVFRRNAIGDHSIMVICGHLVNSQLNLRKKRRRAKLKKEKRRCSVHLKPMGFLLKHSSQVHGVSHN